MPRRIALSLLVVLFAAATLAADESAEPGQSLKRLSTLAVQHGGRVKPLSVYAAEAAAAGKTPAVPAELAAGSGGREAVLALFLPSDAPGGEPLFAHARLLPRPDGWLSLERARAEDVSDNDSALFVMLSTALVATGENRGEGFGDAAGKLADFLEGRYAEAGVSRGRLRAEASLERVKPLTIAAFLYLVAGAIAALFVRKGAPRAATAAVLSVPLAVTLLSTALYGWAAGRIPVNNSYEGLMIFAAALGVFAVAGCARRSLYPVAALAPFMAGAFLIVAEFTPVQRGITPPLPALQSLWLQVHVLTCFVAYAAFAVGFATSLVTLFSRRSRRRLRFDHISYRATFFGFVFLSAGILTGAAWAKQAWGRYWGFDPKETWALITWLVYAGYLHLGLLKGRRERLRALAAVIGFLAVAFTFFGVNYLLSGLHAYA
jgi:ABC-type transport system involved in cytochrome c biogenesis permease subunit